jgi:hypothetical protein
MEGASMMFHGDYKKRCLLTILVSRILLLTTLISEIKKSTTANGLFTTVLSSFDQESSKSSSSGSSASPVVVNPPKKVDKQSSGVSATPVVQGGEDPAVKDKRDTVKAVSPKYCWFVYVYPWQTLTSGVNFTNILRAAFSYESFLRSFYVLTSWVCNFLAKGLHLPVYLTLTH